MKWTEKLDQLWLEIQKSQNEGISSFLAGFKAQEENEPQCTEKHKEGLKSKVNGKE